MNSSHDQSMMGMQNNGMNMGYGNNMQQGNGQQLQRTSHGADGKQLQWHEPAGAAHAGPGSAHSAAAGSGAETDDARAAVATPNGAKRSHRVNANGSSVEARDKAVCNRRPE